jgi:predicted O-linked N-acetylglucosamine transferase (SPINDLY family)
MTFAHKPAPVQVTYVGYPATTGLSAMDYRLTTLDIDPEGSESGYTERLYRLPTTLWCYRPPDDAPQVDPQPPALASGRVTFGSMNTVAKVSAETIAAWAEILRAIPDARLVMTNVPEGTARDQLESRFAAHGIDYARLELHARLPRPDFFALMAAIDIALDPFPYNGTTTTCEALATGLPVITVTGRTAVARSGHAIMKLLGLPGLVGRDVPDYVRIAVDLARDTARLTAMRRTIHTRFLASPLREESLLARDLEDAYRAMWRRWCAGSTI